MAQHGLTTSEHDSIDVDAYYERIYSNAQNYKGQTIVDIFSGGGRDIAKLSDLLCRNGDFVAIDSEAQRIVDMVAKNFQRTIEGDPIFDLTTTHEQFRYALAQQHIAVIQGVFPERPLGNAAEKSDIDLKADFMLCNAGIMFISDDKIDATLSAMANMLAPKGELTLRFSLARDDKSAQLGTSYFIHDPDHVQTVLETSGLTVTRHPDLEDPNGRPFTWVDIQAFKP